MGKPVSVAVYTRISSDQDGSGLGVKRQEEDCRKVCAELGWSVGEVYEDNDISASKGKRRPRFEKMLVDIAEGVRDAVVVYHQDRLTRTPVELERFLGVLAKAGVEHVRFVSGAAVDLGSGDGLMTLRIIGAVAAGESATKSRRVKRKMEERAAAGLPHGTGGRPFGFEPGGLVVRESEAVVVRELADRYLAGESLRSLTVWLHEQQVRTRGGGEWRTGTVKQMLTSARMAGLREANGVVVATAAWPPILTVSQHQRLVAKFNEKASSGQRTARSYLLTGMVRCGRCQGRLFSSRRENSRRYVCMSGPDHGGCGRLTVVAGPLEEFVAEAVLQRLDSPALVGALAGNADDAGEAVVLAESLAGDRAQLEELAGAYGRREVGLPEWVTARKVIEERMRASERTLARLSDSDALVGFLGTSKLREEWANLNLDRQRAIIAAVVAEVVISPKLKTASQALDLERVVVRWRV